MNEILNKECIEVLSEYSGYRITEDLFNRILEANPKLKVGLIEFSSPSDTYDREWMIECFGWYVSSLEWLTYGTPKEDSDLFFSVLADACAAQNIEKL